MSALVQTPFGFTSTAQEVLAGVDLTGKRAIVTGGAAGIGAETARALAGAGAEVVLAVRRPEAGAEVAARINQENGASRVSVAALDLVDLTSVAAFVASWAGPLDILVNNAGIMAVPGLELTGAGHEVQFATNYLGHFALTLGLRTALVEAGAARIVSVSSNAHRFSPVVFEDLDFADRPYDPWSAYGQSKTANVLLAVEATRRWAADGIRANALHPGAIATNLQQHTGGLQTPVDRRKTPAQGAATSALLAASPLLEGIGGRYFDDCHESAVLQGEPGPFDGGVAPWALDPDSAARLWDVATELVG